MQNRITAILSDYDGTLCPTNSVRNQDGTIPEELRQVLWDISKRIPVCIISSKDYHFLHPRTRFARLLSCIMGIETLTLKLHEERGNITCRNIQSNKGKEGSGDTSCIEDTHLMLNDDQPLRANSSLLASLAENISVSYKDVIIDRKFTSDKKILAGITFDYRHLEDTISYKEKFDPFLKKMIQEIQSCPPSAGSYNLSLQTYALHPFIDVYVTKCDKGMAFDYVTSRISHIQEKGKAMSPQKIMYLGDSDNDNPAFKKADISIGIRSDDRLNPELSCTKVLKFDVLAIFLKRLMENNFLFSDDIL
jgi:hydroxymethylpyrimidine pyrophosphatase-like HAD family hydrolase